MLLLMLLVILKLLSSTTQQYFVYNPIHTHMVVRYTLFYMAKLFLAFFYGLPFPLSFMNDVKPGLGILSVYVVLLNSYIHWGSLSV